MTFEVPKGPVPPSLSGHAGALLATDVSEAGGVVGDVIDPAFAGPVEFAGDGTPVVEAANVVLGGNDFDFYIEMTRLAGNSNEDLVSIWYASNQAFRFRMANDSILVEGSSSGTNNRTLHWPDADEVVDGQRASFLITRRSRVFTTYKNGALVAESTYFTDFVCFAGAGALRIGQGLEGTIHSTALVIL